MLHNMLPGCYCAGLTLLQRPLRILTIAKVQSETTSSNWKDVSDCGPDALHLSDTKNFCTRNHPNCICLPFVKHLFFKSCTKRHFVYSTGTIATKVCNWNISGIYVLFFVLCFVCVSASVSQGSGGGLQSDLLITPWLTLTLTWWWGLTGAGILWKVRRRQTKGLNSRYASGMLFTLQNIWYKVTISTWTHNVGVCQRYVTFLHDIFYVSEFFFSLFNF